MTDDIDCLFYILFIITCVSIYFSEWFYFRPSINDVRLFNIGKNLFYVKFCYYVINNIYKIKFINNQYFRTKLFKKHVIVSTNLYDHIYKLFLFRNNFIYGKTKLVCYWNHLIADQDNLFDKLCDHSMWMRSWFWWDSDNWKGVTSIYDD